MGLKLQLSSCTNDRKRIYGHTGTGTLLIKTKHDQPKCLNQKMTATCYLHDYDLHGHDLLLHAGSISNVSKLMQLGRVDFLSNHIGWAYDITTNPFKEVTFFQR